jgi:UDP-glucose 4-epimerase
MNILVTGGNGYIGSHTVVELLSAGHKIAIVDNLKNSHDSVFKKIAKIDSRNIRGGLSAHYCDASNKEALLQTIDLMGPIDMVIHFAAYKSVSESIDKPLDYYENNIGALLNVLNCMQETGIRDLIFSSSAAIYQPDPQGLPLQESSPAGASNPYGRTKLMAEQIIADVVATGKINSILLRYFNPCGAHASGLIGENSVLTPTNLMPIICRAAESGDSVKVFGSDYSTLDGTAVRDYIHVVDLAQAHLKAAERIRKEKKPLEIFNIGTGNGYSVLEVLNTFNKVNSTNVKYEFLERREGDLPSVYANTTLAEEKLDWKAKYALEDMVKSAWEWHRRLRCD